MHGILGLDKKRTWPFHMTNIVRCWPSQMFFFFLPHPKYETKHIWPFYPSLSHSSTSYHHSMILLHETSNSPLNSFSLLFFIPYNPPSPKNTHDYHQETDKKKMISIPLRPPSRKIETSFYMKKRRNILPWLGGLIIIFICLE